MQEFPIPNPQISPQPASSALPVSSLCPASHTCTAASSQPSDALGFLSMQGRGKQDAACMQAVIITGDALPAWQPPSHGSAPPAPLLPTHLQRCHLLPIAKDAEGEGVFGAQPRDHLAALEDDGIHVGAQVSAVLVEVEGVALQATPALLPALVNQDAEVAWGVARPRERSQHLLSHTLGRL